MFYYPWYYYSIRHARFTLTNVYKRCTKLNILVFPCCAGQYRCGMMNAGKRKGDGKLEHSFQTIRRGKPELKFCERFDDKSSLWNYSRHSHPYIELMFFLDGKGNLEVSGKRLSISLFDAVVYPGGWQHQEEVTSERKREVICLWVDLPELQLPGPIHLHDRDGTLRNMFQLIYREAKRESPEPLLLEQELKVLLMLLLRNQNEVKTSEGALAYVLQYIHAHYMEPITLECLADMEHISKSYLSRQFKQQTGMTVISYVNQLRTEAAKRLLIGSNLRVNEIAYHVGFESPKYFYRLFRSLTGDSPASFRKKYGSVSR